MNLYLSLLLLVPAVIAYGERTTTIEVNQWTTAAPPPGPPDSFLLDLNNLRRHYAKKYNVSNMHELIWSENLVNVNEHLDLWIAPPEEEQRTFRFGIIESYENANDKLRSDIDEFMKKSDREKEELVTENRGRTLSAPEFLVPRQRFIWCVYEVCILGPETLFIWNYQQFQRSSEPGADCLDGYENDDGLCVLKDTEKKFIDGINEIRKKYADKFNVPNMHKLTWSKELLGVLESLNLTNGVPTSTMNFRYWILPAFQYNSSSEFETSLENDYFSKNSNGRRDFLESASLESLEFLIPLQKVIACAAKNVKREYKKVCLIGPSGTPKMFATNTASMTRDLTHKLKCSANYKRENGLCALKDPENVSYFGNSEEFLNAVNAQRKKLANKYHIPNMHELTWKQSLATTADSLTWPDDSWTCARHVWRYVPTFYNGITEAIEEEVNHLLTEIHHNEFLEFLKRENETHVGLLELLNPLQKQIGCTSKKGVDPFVLCLLGDEGVFKFWDLKNNAIPGSDCQLGYSNQRGLCSLPTKANAEPSAKKRKIASASRDQHLGNVPRK
ncbi:hypothetical protein GCK72_007578 [Caenorhabditis remanei]|uniref:Uncharacterized protein n=1 Tax=Caenorhabditis remanei TaxID=31234 RepID=A0A6A5HJF8_CAERE|nr:hypothetical protein GCK72_007578 [Caenorhabditis remanei]KAF1767619.1 hypothetical protein GCK72_007578 [Caenorhabditis remanei]